MRRSRILTPVGHREAALQQKQVAVRQEGAVGDVELAVALDREDALVRPLDDRGEDVAVPVEALFRNDDETALVLAVGMGVRHRLEAAVLAQLARRDQEIEFA